MSTQLHFKSNLRDIFFNLFECLNIGTASLGQGPFQSMDEAGAREIIGTFEKLCTNEFAKSYADSDRNPPTFGSDGNVTLPASLKESLKTFYEGDWHKLDHSEALQGFGAPPSVSWAVYELLYGANPIIPFYTFGSTLARVINSVGTEKQKKMFVENMLERDWGGTMVLTEPDAGSDVGAGRTKAKHIKDDLWEIEGVKRFITSGDFDTPENIVHLVLARPDASVPGTKGLSMFIVPKFWVNEDGTLGERNGVYCTNVEKKMGLKGSATCEMTFGSKQPARGFLVGNVHDGIRQMFLVIEQARMAIGMKSMATLSTAYLNALAFTKDRIQGPDLAKAAEKSSPRVRIIDHPDVRRMLMAQKSHAEGMRALCMYAASIKDKVELAQHNKESSVQELEDEFDFLLPLVKGYSSEKSYELLNLSLQCFGGSGYCQDYPIEQYIRDQKIDSLYEGTTHIQAMDFIFRKILRNNGKILSNLFARIQKDLEVVTPGLEFEQQSLARALQDVQGIFVALKGKMSESVYHVGLQGNKVLFAVAETTIGWLLYRQGIVANAKIKTATAKDKLFYEGKLASVKYFAQQVLPALTLTRKFIEASTLDLMSLNEDAF